MTNIFIRGSYKGEYYPINSLEFVDKNGKPFTIDRDYTDFYTEHDGTFKEMWSSVYLWDGENGDYAFSPPPPSSRARPSCVLAPTRTTTAR